MYLTTPLHGHPQLCLHLHLTNTTTTSPPLRPTSSGHPSSLWEACTQSLHSSKVPGTLPMVWFPLCMPAGIHCRVPSPTAAGTVHKDRFQIPTSALTKLLRHIRPAFLVHTGNQLASRRLLGATQCHLSVPTRTPVPISCVVPTSVVPYHPCPGNRVDRGCGDSARDADSLWPDRVSDIAYLRRGRPWSYAKCGKDSLSVLLVRSHIYTSAVPMTIPSPPSRYSLTWTDAGYLTAVS